MISFSKYYLCLKVVEIIKISSSNDILVRIFVWNMVLLLTKLWGNSSDYIFLLIEKKLLSLTMTESIKS